MASTCWDGIQDYTETDVDCGGSACYACGNGLHCGGNSDCASGICINGLCLGSQACQTNAQCATGLCNNADPVNGCPAATNCTCAGTNCTDQRWEGQVTSGDEVNTNGVRRPTSTAAAPTARAESAPATKPLQCAVYTDCASNLCYEQGSTSPCPVGVSAACTCNPGDCRDGKQDGAETDLDCGGGSLVNGVAIGCPGCPLPAELQRRHRLRQQPLRRRQVRGPADLRRARRRRGVDGIQPRLRHGRRGYGRHAGTGGAGTGGTGYGERRSGRRRWRRAEILDRAVVIVVVIQLVADARAGLARAKFRRIAHAQAHAHDHAHDHDHDHDHEGDHEKLRSRSGLVQLAGQECSALARSPGRSRPPCATSRPTASPHGWRRRATWSATHRRRASG